MSDHPSMQICRIEQIVAKGKDVRMRVKWYYRPEETCSGRRVSWKCHYIASDAMGKLDVRQLIANPACVSMRQQQCAKTSKSEWNTYATLLRRHSTVHKKSWHLTMWSLFSSHLEALLANARYTH